MLQGKMRLMITCADSPILLNALNSAGVLMQDISYRDDMAMYITIKHSDYNILHHTCDKQGASIKVIKKTGLQFLIQAVLNRPVILVFLFFLSTLSFYLPSRVLFVYVEGNSLIATNKILDAAENCGIIFGASRREVRSEKMKNALLQSIPELQWAGINTYGCTAIISVKEKTTQDISEESKGQVSSIVASRDGIIQSCTVYRGNPLCSVGQAVKKEQVLVSGYTNCGVVTKATQAQAEINALTFREVQVISPYASVIRGAKQKDINRYSIRIGKKVIKLYKDSGNCDTTCDKIYAERNVQLPGGFILPVTVIKENISYYDFVQFQEKDNTEDWLVSFAEKYLYSDMIAGNIISKDSEFFFTEDAVVFVGKYACVEMIGKVKNEQMIEGE